MGMGPWEGSYLQEKDLSSEELPSAHGGSALYRGFPPHLKVVTPQTLQRG